MEQWTENPDREPGEQDPPERVLVEEFLAAMDRGTEYPNYASHEPQERTGAARTWVRIHSQWYRVTVEAVTDAQFQREVGL